MPLLHLITNLELHNESEQATAEALSRYAARLLDKPESYVVTIVQSGQAMLFGGSSDPCAYLQLKSLGLPEERTAEFSAALCDHVHENLGIETARIYIEFSSPPRHMWGWDRTTFG
jgi:phenylpyruvate tautomerase PptA (4-oxalocrotonate tautomerase family)